MNISTNAALNGLKSATLLQDITAHNLANLNTGQFSAKQGLQTEAAYDNGPQISFIRDTVQQTDLAESMVELKKNQNMYSADLKIIKVQDRMMGELIDLIA